MLMFGLVGLSRGFWREFGVTAGMALVVLATVLFPEAFIGFINRLITNVPRVFGLLLNANVPALPDDLIFGAPGSGRYLLARFALFALLVFLVYNTRYGWAYDGGKPRAARSRGQRLLGGVFGAITGFLWFIALNDFLNALRTLRNTPVLPPEGTTINVPTVSDIPSLIAFVPTLVAVVLIILFVLLLLRLPSIWKN
jgi:hypothetical protein